MRKVTRWQVFGHAVALPQVDGNPFWDIEVHACFEHAGSGSECVVRAFFDGRDSEDRFVWRVRWTPVAEGLWTCRIHSIPRIDDLDESFEVGVDSGSEEKGFLRSNTAMSYGFRFDNGDPFFLFGDTMYNLFGTHCCGVDVAELLRHRGAQGINYVRAPLQVSPYHPKKKKAWQNRDLWPWGGSAQKPDFTELNLEYFQRVDEVMDIMPSLGIGVELILEAWLFEFPFNDRARFLPEHEEMWVNYAISRYSAYPSVYLWCPANEFDYYPNPRQYSPEADHWIDRLSGMIRERDPFSHPIGVHNWGKTPKPMSERVGHLNSFDVYLVQTAWGRERDGSPLCRWLEGDLRYHVPDRNKVTVCAEFGYERVLELSPLDPWETHDEHHTRRGQWRAGFYGVGVIHGFSNTWGPFMRVDLNAAGAKLLPVYYRFMTEIIDFATLRPANELFSSRSGCAEDGNQPVCIASVDQSVVSV